MAARRLDNPIRLFAGLLFAMAACRTTVPPHAPLPPADPSGAWESLLSDVVSDSGFVDYAFLSRHRQALDEFVAWISRDRAVPKNPRARLAFWLNARNALVLVSVLDHDRPRSVLDVPARFFGKPGSGFFFDQAFPVGQDTVSLSEIEHERIRLRSMDYRVHAAMTDAARSSPPLRNELYRQPGLEAQLKDQMHRWISDVERGVRIEGDMALFSAVFEQYSNDFSFWTAGASLCDIAARHSTGSRRDDFVRLGDSGCPHRFLAFDWRLNEAD